MSPIIALGRLGTLCLFAACVAACSPHPSFIGRWEGHRSLKGNSSTPSYVLATMNVVKLNVQRNGEFALQDMGIPVSGTLAINGNKATLNVTKIAGVSADRASQATRDSLAEIVLTAQPDGSLLFDDPKGLDTSSVSLKRIATASDGES